ncbi:pentatricopeptide repeat-containing protein At3g12770 [Amborella trichopoda]|nr:pentatricopeptide repeat-containing protein At3g12770 [Amborella trichopoda]|eukprot:XP_011628229.1 pentatricopeptide repeat-containing protein At3g12770 [Amborella trichopoda]
MASALLGCRSLSSSTFLYSHSLIQLLSKPNKNPTSKTRFQSLNSASLSLLEDIRNPILLETRFQPQNYSFSLVEDTKHSPSETNFQGPKGSSLSLLEDTKNPDSEARFHTLNSSSPLQDTQDRVFFTDDIDAYTSLVDNSSHIKHLKQIHGHFLSLGLQKTIFFAAKFINACSKFNELNYACQIFSEIPQRSSFLWNAMIRSYSQHSYYEKTLELYVKMQEEGVRPDGFTLPCVLKVCTGLSDLNVGRELHAQIFRLGFESDVFVQNGLVAMYSKHSQLCKAFSIFERIHSKSVVSWTSIISGYAQNGFPYKALQIFREMKRSSTEPDFISLVSALKAYTDIESLDQGMCVHGCAIKIGLETEPDLLIALTAMYAKCGEAKLARLLFDMVSNPCVILWNAMISGYVKNGFAYTALGLFREMIHSKAIPDSVTIRSVILACAQTGSVDLGKWVHEFAKRTQLNSDVYVMTTLIDMYAKCGCITIARELFDGIIGKDVVLWTAMIMGYGMHGHAREALELYREMRHMGMVPNDVTFIGLLCACTHAGLVEEGWRFFESMKRDYGIEPRHQHYACMVDLMGRAGYVQEAYEFIMTMPMEPEVTVWGALLSACRVYRNVRLGEYAAEKVFAVDPRNAGHYVQLSNIYAEAGMWDCVERVRVLMRERGLMKPEGLSGCNAL